MGFSDTERFWRRPAGRRHRLVRGWIWISAVFLVSLPFLTQPSFGTNLSMRTGPGEIATVQWVGSAGLWQLVAGKLLPSLAATAGARAALIDPDRGRCWWVRSDSLAASNLDGSGAESWPLQMAAGVEPFLVASPTTGSELWIAVGSELLILSGGDLRSFAELDGEAIGLELSPAADRLWVATRSSVVALDVASGDSLTALDLGRGPQVKAMAVDPLSSDVFVALDKEWLRYEDTGSVLARSPLGGLRGLAPDGFGGVWGLWGEQVLRLHEEGGELLERTPFLAPELPTDLALDPATRTLWVAGRKQLLRLTAAGDVLERISLPDQAELRHFVRALPSVAAGGFDTTAPQLRFALPPEPVGVGERLSFGLSLVDAGSGIDLESLRVRQIGSMPSRELATNCVPTPEGADCLLEQRQPPGLIILEAVIADFSGNLSSPERVTVQIPEKRPLPSPDSVSEWEERGRRTHRQVFQGEDFETIDLATGRLLLELPLGPTYSVGPLLHYQFRLVYNSNVWRRVALDCAAEGRPCGGPWQSKEEALADPPTGSLTLAVPHPEANAGLGWQLHFGRLYRAAPPAGLDAIGKSLWPHRQELAGPPSKWLYVAPDGTEHRFYGLEDRPREDTLGREVSYTLDGSRFRLKEESARKVTIERPDGVVSVFERTGAKAGTLFCGEGVTGCWRLAAMVDPYGNELALQYQSDSPEEETWTLRDSTGRQHFLRFEQPPRGTLGRRASGSRPVGVEEVGALRRRLLEVDLAAFGGQRSVFELKYREAKVARGCLGLPLEGEQPPFGAASLAASVLRRIDIPTQQDFFFATEEGTPEACSDLSGRLKELTLPSGGRLRYSWKSWDFPTRLAGGLASDKEASGSDPTASGLALPSHQPSAAAPYLPGSPASEGDSASRQSSTLPARQKSPSSLDRPASSAPRNKFGEKEGQAAANFSSSSSYPGVASKERLLPDGAVEGAWQFSAEVRHHPGTEESSSSTYRRSLVTGPVVDGRFSQEVFYTSLRGPGTEPGTGPREVGFSRHLLPIRGDDSGGGKVGTGSLSREIYQCAAGQPCGREDKLRSVYLSFAAEPAPSLCAPLSETVACRQTHLSLIRERTVFHDDEDRFLERAWHDFNGLGSARRTVVRDDFEGTGEVRFEERLDWVRGHEGLEPGGSDGLFPKVDFHRFYPSVDEPWILSSLGSRRLSKSGQTYRTDYEVDEAGQGVCARYFTFPEGRGETDVVAHWKRGQRPGIDAGLPVSERRLGGDGAALSTEELCPTQDLSESAIYRQDLTYQHLQLASRRRPGFPFIYRATIDGDSGLAAATFSPGNQRTDWQYDRLGQLLRRRPEPSLAEATTTWVYRSPEGGSPATERMQWDPEGEQLTKEIVTFDPFGRRSRQEVMRALDTGEQGLSQRRFTYDATGRLQRRSLWQDPDSFDPQRSVTFAEQDPFGRPRQVVAPDGTQRRYSYLGARGVRETVEMRLSGTAGEEPVLTERGFDFRGDLSRFEGPLFSETYQTDPIGDRTRVERRVGERSQERQWIRDGRGFLVEERHPELGEASSPFGSIHYRRDALGEPVERFDGEHKLIFDRDASGRLLRVREGERVWQELFWGDSTMANEPSQGLGQGLGQGQGQGSSAPGRAYGQIVKEVRHNYLGSPGPVSDWRVTETYRYQGALGLRSHRTTRVDWISPEGEGQPGPEFSTGWKFDALGRLVEIRYPRCLGPVCSEEEDAPGFDHSVTTKYQADQVVSISSPLGFSATYTYQADFQLQRTLYGNGILGLRGPDLHGLPRARRLRYLLGSEAHFDSGFLRYDGAGRRWRFGEDRRILDAAGRPILARAGVGEELRREGRTYDGFGNLLSRQMDGPGSIYFGVDEKNRLRSWGQLRAGAHGDVRLDDAGSSDVRYDNAGRRVGWGGNPNDGFEAVLEWDALDQLLAFRRYSPDDELQIHLYGPGYQRLATYDSVDGAIRWFQRDLSGRILRSWYQQGTPGEQGGGGALLHEKDLLYGPEGLLGVLGPGSQRHYVHHDLSGTPRLATGSKGEVVARWQGLLFGTPPRSVALRGSASREEEAGGGTTEVPVEPLCGPVCAEREPNGSIWRIERQEFHLESQRLLAPRLLAAPAVDSPGSPWSLYAPRVTNGKAGSGR